MFSIHKLYQIKEKKSKKGHDEEKAQWDIKQFRKLRFIKNMHIFWLDT